MHFIDILIDILNLSLSSLGIYDFIFSLRYLIPCYIIPCLSADLNKTLQLLNHAEAIHAIPPESEYKTNLDLSANQFAAMRVESNHAQGVFQQLRLAIQRGLTCRLYVLYYRIKRIKIKLEMAIDKQQLRNAETDSGIAVPSPAAATDSGMAVPSPAAATDSGIAVPSPAAATAPPVNNLNVMDPTLPLPATSS